MAIWIETNQSVLNKVSKLGWKTREEYNYKYIQLSPKNLQHTNRSKKPPVQSSTRLITELDLDQIILLRHMGMTMPEVFKTLFPKEIT